METPKDFGRKLQQNWAKTVNDELTTLKQEIEKATPVYTGSLRASWHFNPVNLVTGQASLETFSPHFPKVEAGLPKDYLMGSTERARLVGWVQAKMKVSFSQAPFIASHIAAKYKTSGRPGVSYVGAAPAEVPKRLGQFPQEPVKGGLIDQAFRRLDKVFK